MTSIAVRALARTETRWRFILCDINEAALAAVCAEVGKTATATARRLDLFDATQLQAVIREADFVLHGAGPFQKTAKLVRAACIEAGVAYVDLDDDVESSLEAVAMDEAARARGVPLFVGCGASPGFTNILARDVLAQLDEPHSIDVAWCVGDEGPQEMGRAVVEHTMHIGAGNCQGWREGRAVMGRTFEASRVMPFSPPLGDYLVYEVAHPETVHLPRTFPHLQSAVCWGGLHPAPMNGIIRGVAIAHAQGRLSLDQACEFFQAVSRDDAGTWAGWKEAWSGMRQQNRRGEVSFIQTLRFLGKAVRGKHETPHSGVVAIAVGMKQGRKTEIIRRSPPSKRGGFWELMATCTGNSAAAFISLAADQSGRRAGALFPEAWADPEAFYARCARMGFDLSDVIEPDFITRSL
jgi:hypothetical protein